jgi:hypothetical protein
MLIETVSDVVVNRNRGRRSVFGVTVDGKSVVVVNYVDLDIWALPIENQVVLLPVNPGY